MPAWSTVRVFLTRLADLRALIPFLFCLPALGAGMIVSFLETSVLRNSYVFDFVYYLCPAFVLLLMHRDNGKKEDKSTGQIVFLFCFAALIAVIVISWRYTAVLKYSDAGSEIRSGGFVTFLSGEKPDDFVMPGTALIKTGKPGPAFDAANEALRLKSSTPDRSWSAASVVGEHRDLF